MKKNISMICLLILLQASFASANYWVSNAQEGRVYNFYDDGALHFYVDKVSDPNTLALDPATGNVIVLTGPEKGVLVITPQGDMPVSIGPYLSYDPAFSWPLAATYDPEGNMWIVDGAGSIAKLDSTGSVLFKITGQKSPAYPRHIAYHAQDQSIWVLGVSELVKYDLQGLPQLRIAGFDHPEGMDISDDGKIAVADTDNGMIKVYTSDGQLLSQISNIRMPYDVAFQDNDLWVVNTLERKIMKFNLYGKSLGNIIHIDIGVPKKIFVDDARHKLYIVDKYQLWRLDATPGTSHAEIVYTFESAITDVALDLGTARNGNFPATSKSAEVTSQPLALNDMRSTSAALDRRAIPSASAYAPASNQEYQDASSQEVYQTMPDTGASDSETEQELVQLRQQVAEQRDQINTFRTETPAPAEESKSSEIIGVLVVTFLILLVLAFLGGMMLKKKE